MSNLDELARAVREHQPKRPPAAAPPIVEYRTPPTRAQRRWALPPMVTLSRVIGWTLTAFGALLAVMSLLTMLGAVGSLVSSRSAGQAMATALLALGFLAGALAVAALGQIVVLLAELVVQGRRSSGEGE